MILMKLFVGMKGQRRLRNRGRVRRRLVVRGRGAVYHVMSRMVRRQYWFGDEEKEVFVAMMRKQAAFTGVEVLTYCVLGNHFHLLLRVPQSPLGKAGEHGIDDRELLKRYAGYYGEQLPQSAYSAAEFQEILDGDDLELAEQERCRVLARMGDLSVFMQELKHRFSIWFNHRHKSEGTIWSARFKSVLVEDEAEVLTKVAAYIDLNPVRAGLVDDPGVYRWSGYGAAMAGKAKARAGLCGLFGSQKLPPYGRAIARYRVVLYGKGGASKRRHLDGKDPGRIHLEKVVEVLRQGGAVPLEEALRCRVRYFSEGLVLGRQAFVKEAFEENRELFGKKRKPTDTLLNGPVWGGLCALRRLRTAVFAG